MVDISSIKAFYQELSWETEVFAYLQSLFINVFCGEIFCDAAIVSIA